MKEKSIKKVIELICKTGDKMLVFDDDGFTYVLMSIEDYEDLLLTKSGVEGLTEEELLDKINREISIWKSNQEDSLTEDFDFFENENNSKEVVKKVDNFESPEFEINESDVDVETYYVEPL